MENNINLDAHSSLIIADGSIVEINGQKVLLTLVRDADAPEPKVIDLHKDSWGVYNDGSQRFKDTVVKWLNEKVNACLTGNQKGCFYGHTSAENYGASPLTSDFTHIITLDEFCAFAYPETSEKGSELVGKWFRCLESHEPIFTSNKWYQCVKSIHEPEAFSTNHEAEHDGFQGKNHKRFDLSNPLDYNPEMLVGKYWNGNKIESITFPPNSTKPHFYFGQDLHVECASITPSDVTDTPPLPSLKYEDCFERVKPKWYVSMNCDIKDWYDSRKDGLATERQAKQLAATIKLMTIMQDANGGEFIPKYGETACYPMYDSCNEKIYFDVTKGLRGNQLAFCDYETAQRAYEANKEIFHDYFGINE